MRTRALLQRPAAVGIGLLLVLAMLGLATPAQAVVSFSIAPITWDVIGLDSNDVTKGPNDFEVGARACNTGTTVPTTVTGTFTFDSANAFVNIQPGTNSTQVIHNMAVGACFDFYFNIEITRNAAAYTTSRQYHITVDDGAGATAQTPAGRQINVEKLVSQNRNTVTPTAGCPTCGIWGAGGSPNPAPTNVLVGSTYTYVFDSSTATGGYGSFSTFLNFQRGIFQIESVTTVLSAFPNPTNTFCCQDNPPNVQGTITKIWADACGFDEDPASANYKNCAPTNPPKNDKAGNNTETTYVVRILKTGTGTLEGLVWDGSGSSFHYNNDFGQQVISVTATAPTAVQFRSASASRTAGGDLVQWSTGYESNNLGFNVYSQQGGTKIKLNDSLIAGSALSAGADAVDGRSYHWLVPWPAPPGATYLIEAVDLDGHSDWFGPVSVSGPAGASAGTRAPAQASSTSLAALGSASGQSQGPLHRSAAQPNLASPLLAKSARIAGGSAVKISVDHEGWYAVSEADLAAKGLDVSSPSKLHLYAEGVEQPIQITGGSVEFYGLGLDTAQTATRVYWLVKETGDGLRIPTSTLTGGPAAPASFQSVVQRRDRSVYFSSLLNGATSNFFGSPVTAAPLAQTIHLNDVAAPGGDLNVSLQGVTSADHHVSVSLNGSPVGTVDFTGRSMGTLSASVGGLIDGDNTVTLTSSGALDVSLVDRIRVTYSHSYKAENDLLRFTVPGGSSFSVAGFTSSEVHVADVSDPASPVDLSSTTGPDGGGGYAVSATAPGTGLRTLYAYTTPEQPVSVEANSPSSLSARSNAADMLIVTTKALRSSLVPLQHLHARQGLRTDIVDIADVYDEFGFGEASAHALKNFLTYTQSKWATAPRYVLLGGDGSLDPRGFMGPAGVSADVIPVKLVDTQFMETASDPWFAQEGGNPHPAFALGRLPARTPAEAGAMVSKIIDYSSSAASNQFVVAADQPDPGYSFSNTAAKLAKNAPAGAHVQQINRSDANARTNLLKAINRGPSVLDYIGHGSVDLWRGDMFTSADPPTLTNTQHPAFFVSMTCLNGYFMDPNLDSLSESMLKAQGGAVAAWASTGQTFPEPQAQMNQNLFKSLSNTTVIGDAVVSASQGVHDADVLATWALLGDPAMRLR